MSHHTFKNASEALPILMKFVMDGDEVGSRNGATREQLFTHVTLTEPWNREILTPHRKASLPAQIAETMWVLSGRDDIEWLSNYLPRAADFSDDGKTWRGAYGPRIRRWRPSPIAPATITHAALYEHSQGGVPIASWSGTNVQEFDQLAYVVDLLREDRATRRAVIQIYNPEIDSKPGKDIPCNDWLHFLSRDGKLDLHVAVRSNDLMWGWSGINAFEWSALLEIVAGMVGMQVGSLHFSISSLHLYDQHWSKADKIADADYFPVFPGSIRFNAKRNGMRNDALKEFDTLTTQWFDIEAFIRDGNRNHERFVNEFPEPMLQGWLRVLQWYWSDGDVRWLEPIKNTRLATGALMSPAPKPPDTISHTKEPDQSEFLNYVIHLHNEKHAAYGDSWKRRGEMLGIMANIARKIDRLGGGETADESSTDTAIDLLVYLAKYRVWLDDDLLGQVICATQRSDTPDAANALLAEVENGMWTVPAFRENVLTGLEEILTATFDRLEDAVVNQETDRVATVGRMLRDAYCLARGRWERQRDEYKGADHE